MKRVVIDTNIYLEFMRGHESVRAELLAFDVILIPMTVLGELLYGFTNGAREEANRAQLDRFLAREDVKLLSVSRTTADYYALLMSALRKNGTPLPTNDVWIAAAASAAKVPLISRDKHFMKIFGLQLIRPE